MATIAITGAGGLIGHHLTRELEDAGYEVARVVRGTPEPGQIGWSPLEGTIDTDALRGCTAVIHLAGEPIVGMRWTEEKKKRIYESRVQGTRLIAETLAAMPDGPRTLISASAIGFFGDRGDEILTEESGPGEGFLAEVVQAWEEAADPARDAGIRVAHTRFGLALAPDGGVLGKMLPAFKLGVGGVVGSGDQYFSWVSVDDVVGAIRFVLEDPSLDGVFNVTAPQPVTNAQFTDTLGEVLHRPTVIPLPSFAVKLAFGEMGNETLLAGQRALPERLIAQGYTFRDPVLEPTLRRLLQS